MTSDILLNNNLTAQQNNLRVNVVIGGGHAGVEAATASARIGIETLLITKKFSNIGEMSCNPAIGGVAKGTIVREVDALGGVMGEAIDCAGIHFKILNISKGPAVHSPRAQADRKLYKSAVQNLLSNYKNLHIIIGEAIDFNIIGNQIDSLIIEVSKEEKDTNIAFTNQLEENAIIKAQSLLKNHPAIKEILQPQSHSSNKYQISCFGAVITTGTFLNGTIHCGKKTVSGGRIAEKPSLKLANKLKELEFSISRLKTGTPPRIDRHSINWQNLETQKSDNPPKPFSYLNSKINIPQIDCFITYTNQNTHKIIADNLAESAMYGGQISGRGPRYCPSIEDKINRFADKERHQVFLEPEGLDSDIIYPNGISTSLPLSIQEEFVRSIHGLEKAIITQAGYAIEYDFVDPRELLPTLETKKILNLFLAGQINGTTGYEEAAGQGIVAGINLGLKAKNILKLAPEKQLILDRFSSYIGVMIDDLTTLGTNEPYRMLTSRAEYRLHIRADNADLRLTPIAIDLGIATKNRAETFIKRQENIISQTKLLQSLKISPSELNKHGINISLDGSYRSGFDLLALPEINFGIISKIWPEETQEITEETAKQLEIDGLYYHYLKRQEADVLLLKKEQQSLIPRDLDYYKIESLSNEVREKLSKIRPTTIATASKIAGITPTAIIALIIYLRKISKINN
jgi:tRNA uridine 5-carboxymethylaminomethyl modification enzyme